MNIKLVKWRKRIRGWHFGCLKSIKLELSSGRELCNGREELGEEFSVWRSQKCKKFPILRPKFCPCTRCPPMVFDITDQVLSKRHDMIWENSRPMVVRVARECSWLPRHRRYNPNKVLCNTDMLFQEFNDGALCFGNVVTIVLVDLSI